MNGDGGSLKAIALDFDGVILESVDIKTRAFRTLFSAFPDQVERIVQFHVKHGGLSRYEKFSVIYRDFLRKSLSETEKERLGSQFSALVAEEIRRCPFVPGALEFLRQASISSPVFIVSGTPEQELLDLVEARNIHKYVSRSYGSPLPKDEILRGIMAARGWLPGEILFVGDSIIDYEAAQTVGAFFVGRVSYHSGNPFGGTSVRTVRDLFDLAREWPEILAEMSLAQRMIRGQ